MSNFIELFVVGILVLISVGFLGILFFGWLFSLEEEENKCKQKLEDEELYRTWLKNEIAAQQMNKNDDCVISNS